MDAVVRTLEAASADAAAWSVMLARLKWLATHFDQSLAVPVG